MITAFRFAQPFVKEFMLFSSVIIAPALGSFDRPNRFEKILSGMFTVTSSPIKLRISWQSVPLELFSTVLKNNTILFLGASCGQDTCNTSQLLKTNFLSPIVKSQLSTSYFVPSCEMLNTEFLTLGLRFVLILLMNTKSYEKRRSCLLSMSQMLLFIATKYEFEHSDLTANILCRKSMTFCTSFFVELGLYRRAISTISPFSSFVTM